MAIDMVHELLMQHNPVLACIAKGHGVLECCAIYGTIKLKEISSRKYDNSHFAGPLLNYRIAHSLGKERKNFVRTGAQSRYMAKQPTPTITIPHSVYRHDTNRRALDRKPYSSLFR